ncbi:hypothetical protein [Arthrobacter sp. NPDC058127]|uniref:hypothetical protein n=1 Tax=Arthrobacter sp. NPDC058127 TaxID=3346351 RepID=UPI0036EB4768
MRVLRWDEGRAAVDELLRARKLEQVSASEEMAEYLLSVAAKHIESASLIAESDPMGSYQMSYDGARKALSAVLQIQGLRPTSSGGHYVIEECLKAQLGKTGREIVGKFSVMRRIRNDNEYPQQPEDAMAVEEALEQIIEAQLVLDGARKLVEVLPPYGS